MKVMGVDPGLKGAIAVWDGDVLEIDDVPSVPARSRGNEVNVPQLIEYVKYLSDGCHICYFEWNSSMPRQGVASTFKFGVTTGIMLGIISVYVPRIERVTSQSWKKKMKLTKDKQYSINRAIQLFPQYHGLFTRPDRAEAALLAHYGYDDYWLSSDLGQPRKVQPTKRRKVRNVS